MTAAEVEQLVREVHSRAPVAAASPLHGDTHWRSVAAVGARLIDAGEPADPLVVTLFALLHDSQRVNDGTDPQHGPRAARFAEALYSEGHLLVTPTQLEVLVTACEDHTGGLPTSDPTIGVCWDADRLNLARVGKTVDPYWISTRSALDEGTMEWAASLHAAPPSWSEVLHR